MRSRSSSGIVEKSSMVSSGLGAWRRLLEGGPTAAWLGGASLSAPRASATRVTPGPPPRSSGAGVDGSSRASPSSGA
eukprot:CAMPEP_0204339292 /NCGR_PEP_ID=MMETSP0469-20131031/21694_1 /ASSEMBLY_ACC=CAM_ASM_000384 /TAXON_ID=2969 /ORGANISM="Oxyrrhis marina" /LENGTH=76 /DNA_ID=CAMNT_0051323621 /DNA_START=306 /DNA_END=533 /DNA_ORIENTATION=+